MSQKINALIVVVLLALAFEAGTILAPANESGYAPVFVSEPGGSGGGGGGG